MQSNPLAAFVLAESALAVRLIHIVHHCLAAINRSLKSGLPLSVSLMESAIDISSFKVPCYKKQNKLQRIEELN